MIIALSMVIGIALGVMTARKHGGNRKDKAQYGAVFGIIFGLIGTMVTVVIERLAT